MSIPVTLPTPEGCNTPELVTLWNDYNATRKALAKVRPGQSTFRAVYAASIAAYRAFYKAYDARHLEAGTV